MAEFDPAEFDDAFEAPPEDQAAVAEFRALAANVRGAAEDMRGAAERMAVTVQEFEAKAARREAAIMGRTIDPAEHQAAVKTLLEGLRREAAQVEAARQALEKTPEALTAAVANAATTGVANGAATVQAAASGMVSAAQAVQAELQRMLTWWTAWTAGISAIIVIAAVGLVWGQTAWARHQLDDLQSQKAAVQADVLQLQAQQTDLERRGRRLIWHTCGRDPCLEVSPSDPGTWSVGGVRLAIPATTRGH